MKFDSTDLTSVLVLGFWLFVFPSYSWWNYLTKKAGNVVLARILWHESKRKSKVRHVSANTSGKLANWDGSHTLIFFKWPLFRMVSLRLFLGKEVLPGLQGLAQCCILYEAFSFPLNGSRPQLSLPFLIAPSKPAAFSPHSVKCYLWSQALLESLVKQ